MNTGILRTEKNEYTYIKEVECFSRVNISTALIVTGHFAASQV